MGRYYDPESKQEYMPRHKKGGDLLTKYYIKSSHSPEKSRPQFFGIRKKFY